MFPQQTNKICIASHLGRPQKQYDENLSLAPIGERLAELLNLEVLLYRDYEKDPIDQALKQLGKNQIVLLEKSCLIYQSRRYLFFEK